MFAPFHQITGRNVVTRRDLVTGLAAMAAMPRAVGATGTAPANDGGEIKIDPRFAVLISDIHIAQPLSDQKYKTGQEYPWVSGLVKKFVGEILALRPRPAHVFCLGDVSLSFSEEREYEIAAELLKPLDDAGIKLVMTVGNHDLREPFLKHLGKWAGTSPVSGRIVSVTHLPDFDFILLDSLKEPKPEDRGKYEALTGCGLGKAQQKWLEETLAVSKRPTIVAAHHTAWALGIKKLLRKAPTVFGYIHGHNHKWDVGYLFDYGKIPLVRSQGIASFSLDRDIGYAYLHSFPDRAELTFVARDYFFPRKLADDERPPLWDDIVRDNTGRKVSFPFKK